MSRWVLAAVLALGQAACGSEDDDPPAFPELVGDASFPGTPGAAEDFAELFEHEPLVEGCAVSNPSNLEVRTELRIFQGDGVSDADVRDFLGGLQRYYAQYGITMFARYDVIRVALPSALTMNLSAIALRVRAETGVDMNRVDPDTLPDDRREEVLRATGRAILHNTREVLRVYGSPRRNVVNVVLLERMVTDIPEELMEFEGLAGLGLSPELLAAFPSEDPAQQLYDWLDVTNDFTPTAFVGVEPVRRFLPVPDVVIAHEVGHAYGLVHVMDEANLLHSGALDCGLSLDDEQLGAIRTATERLSHFPSVESVSLTSRASEFVRAVGRFASLLAE